MDTLPLFHNLRGARCVVVGAGEVAARKLNLLLSADAAVEVIAPQSCAAISQLAEAGRITLLVRLYQRDDLTGASLVIAATDDPAVNKQVSEHARAQFTPVNVVDSPDLCTVIFPSIVDRSPVQIAIGTNGTAPVLARMLRTQLEALLPGGLGQLADLAGRLRSKVKVNIPGESERKAFWEKVFQGPIAELMYSGRSQAAEDSFNTLLTASANTELKGEVYLVGGGPGDPDLLTLRALRLMQQADIVLYDRLISDAVLDRVRRDSERIYVGKKAGEHPITQANINEKLVEFARAGKRVLRLKGGDPFIFGRGGEEIEHLSAHGISFQVVPGVTAASGCASYAGIPLTHRDYAQSVIFQTGHRKGDTVDLDWEILVKPNQTLVFYMPINGLYSICDKLQEYGLSAEMPAALVENGTRPEQRVFTGDLQTLPAIIEQHDIKAPTLLIVGEVVTLRNTLSWFGEEGSNG